MYTLKQVKEIIELTQKISNGDNVSPKFILEQYSKQEDKVVRSNNKYQVGCY